MNILIAGCGYIGTALGLRLIGEGHHVWGIRRRIGGMASPFVPITADLTIPETLQVLPSGVDVVVYAASPDESLETAYRAAYVDGLRNLLGALARQRQRPRRILFTSSTAVYAQESGEWVDETSPTAPAYFSGRCLLEAEQEISKHCVSGVVVRFGGIYGPGRTRLVEQVRKGAASYQSGPPQYANHIHRDDCVGVLRHLMTLDQPDSIYLGVDDEPVDRGVLLRWLADRLGVPPPRVEASRSDAHRRTRSNKRCKNARLVSSGYRFRYPTFWEGYAAILEPER